MSRISSREGSIALVLSVAVVFGALTPEPASAQEHRRSRARTPIGDAAIPAVIGGVVALGAAAGTHFATIHTPGPEGAWRGGILLDEGVRNAFRLENPTSRETAATVSDALLIASMANALVVDAIAIPLAQDDPHLVWQATTAYSIAMGISLVLNDVVKQTVGRARPFERECADNPNAEGCQSPDTFMSFYSGHTAMAFTSAGFSCAMHLSRNLYGNQAADAAACAASLAVAATTGAMRIAADRHYFSDVIVGAVLGFLVGYIVPLFVVPSRRVEPEERDIDDEGIAAPLPGPTVMALPMFAPGPDGQLGSGTFGVSISGTF